MRFQDKVVVITGAGSGIGRATALAFAEQGARIAACDLDQRRLDELAVELGDRLLVALRVDVADRAQMSAFATAVHAKVPAAEIVVNNAGVGVGGPFLETTLDDWDWILGVNLRGVIHGCHFFAPKMVGAGRGHIVNLSSILGIYPAANVTAYVASKFAVRGFSEALRGELAQHGVGVTAICPGLIATEIAADSRFAGKMGDRKQQIVAAFRRRGAPPATVAEAIIDAVATNPAIRTVGADARVLAALVRIAPRTLQRISGTLQRRFAAGSEGNPIDKRCRGFDRHL